ncbi:MAG: phospholipase [Paenibacillus sp.]|nr:phospholipase [Paenibacillus sp.]
MNHSARKQDHSYSDLVLLPKARKKISKKPWLLGVMILVLFYTAVVVYHTNKPLPDGISVEGPIHYVTDTDIHFLSDLTYKGHSDGQTIQEQNIFERVYKAIDEAKQFIVVDMFLYNGYYKKEQSFPPLSQTLTDKLIAQKKKYPQMSIVVITDAINTSYGSHPSPELERLQAAGIETVLTDVDPLRDSTPLYSAWWRIFAQWFGQSGNATLPNGMANRAPDMTTRSYLKLLNVKANHRKVIVTEQTVIVPSANAHDASFYNSNSAIEVRGDLIGDVLESEQAAIRMSDSSVKLPQYNPVGPNNGNIQVRLLTEGKILDHVRKDLSEAGADDTIWMGMFYLADRQVVRQLLKASDRGAQIRLILDPNENAFGSEKIGIPNRPVASELLKKSGNRIQVRWYNTTKEQYHTKLMVIESKEHAVIHNGSANFTSRNLDDLNLETNLKVVAPTESKVATEVNEYFRRLWNNEGAAFTLDYTEYQEETVFLKRILYRLQGWLGFTTF